MSDELFTNQELKKLYQKTYDKMAAQYIEVQLDIEFFESAKIEAKEEKVLQHINQNLRKLYAVKRNKTETIKRIKRHIKELK